MKHLKRFNESLEPVEVDELKDFCETSLAYLLDDGYNVSLSIRDQVKYPGKNHVIVSLGLPEEKYVPGLPYSSKFYWNDVKDYYIPFLQMLVRRYELLPYKGDGYVYFNTDLWFDQSGEIGFDYFSIDEVINDRVGGMDHIVTGLWAINLQIVDKI
jgi:hypothetical protein